MSDDNQTEIEFLTAELDDARQRLAAAESHYQVLATLCAGHHALLFGDYRIPPKDPDLVMRAIAYSYAFKMLEKGAKNFVTQDILIDEVPGSTDPFLLNVTVQRVEGKSPSQILGETRSSLEAVTSALALLAPDLAETIAPSRPEEIPGLVAEWLKSHALACPVDSTAYTQSHT